jgi:hypothetical protein
MANEPGRQPGPAGEAPTGAGFIDEGRPRSARALFVPRGHRLFVVFDDRRAANRALFQWSGGMPLPKGAWVYDGPVAAAELDPDHDTGGWLALLNRMFAFVFSSNVEYVRGLSLAVRGGAAVLAVHVPDRATADDAARGMRRLGGHSFAYVMHGNFVPVIPAPVTQVGDRAAPRRRTG